MHYATLYYNPIHDKAEVLLNKGFFSIYRNVAMRYKINYLN